MLIHLDYNDPSDLGELSLLYILLPWASIAWRTEPLVGFFLDKYDDTDTNSSFMNQID